MSEILFICEHGSAKSMVAAAHFNHLAEASGLPMRAISRGTDPDSVVHPVAVDGLTTDGLTPPDKPRLLSTTDLDTARKVVAFSELPVEYAGRAVATIWTVPPVSEHYGIARDAIVERVHALIAELSQK